jgi:Mn2+/Fe2+ NRAMP family transporter
MGAETAINAAKQETKYFLVLGAVLVSDFILIVWGLVVCRSFFSDVSLTKDRKKWRVIDTGRGKKTSLYAIIWPFWLVAITKLGATVMPTRPMILGLSMRQTR